MVKETVPGHLGANSGDDTIAVNERYGRITTRSRIWGGMGTDLIHTGDGRDTIYGKAVYEIFYNGKRGEDPSGLDDVLLS